MDVSALAHVPTDIVIVGVFAALAMFDAVRSGAQRACTLALALPIASMLFSALSGAAVLGALSASFSTPLAQAMLFAVLFVVAYLLANRLLGLSYGGEAGQPIQALLAGCAATALLLVFWTQTPALQSLWHFGPQIQGIFGETYRFWWLVASYAALAFVRG